jgi:predicted DNA-binding transcriptional regulator AlpA
VATERGIPGESTMLTVAEAAERLGLSPQVVYSYCQANEDFPAIDLGMGSRASWRIPSDELELWVNSRREQRRRRIASAETARLQLQERWRQPRHSTNSRSD